MGQKLFVIRNDKYRLDITSFDENYESIKQGESKYSYRFSIKEKLSQKKPLESYDANAKEGKIGFDLKPQLPFGVYLYAIELISIVNGKKIDELAYGFIEIIPDIIESNHR
jgi:hypothetical protein